MKKIVLALVIVAMFLQLGTVAFAAEGDDNSYTLVTHWDFDGENPYADKATSGTAENLTVTGTVNTADGIAHIPDGANYLSASGAEGTDLYSFKNKTILIKAQVVRTGGWVMGVFSTKAGLCYVCEGDKTGTLCYDDNTGTRVNIKSADKIKVSDLGYRMYAITIAYDEATGTTTFNTYISTSSDPTSAEDFVKVITETQTTAFNADGMEEIYLGKRADHLEKARNAISYIDDVKVFDGVLTPEQMASESPRTPGSENEGGENEGNEGNEGNNSGNSGGIVTPIVPGGNTNTGNNTENTEADTTPQTSAPETTNTAEDTSADNAAKGCGSVVSVGAVGIVAVVAGCALSRKRRK